MPLTRGVFHVNEHRHDGCQIANGRPQGSIKADGMIQPLGRRGPIGADKAQSIHALERPRPREKQSCVGIASFYNITCRFDL